MLRKLPRSIIVEVILFALVALFVFASAESQELTPDVDHLETIRLGWDEEEGHTSINMDKDVRVKYHYTVYACDKPIPDQDRTDDPITCPDGRLHYWSHIVSNAATIKYPAPEARGIAYVRIGVTNTDGHTLSDVKIQYIYPTATLKPPVNMEISGARLIIETER